MNFVANFVANFVVNFAVDVCERSAYLLALPTSRAWQARVDDGNLLAQVLRGASISQHHERDVAVQHGEHSPHDLERDWRPGVLHGSRRCA